LNQFLNNCFSVVQFTEKGDGVAIDPSLYFLTGTRN